MSESVVGLITPSTRQNAGRFWIGSLPGAVKLPLGTDCDEVTVVFGSAILNRLSQDTAGLMLAGIGFVAKTQPFVLTKAALVDD